MTSLNKSAFDGHLVSHTKQRLFGHVFFDATEQVAERSGLPDGLKVDEAGNLFATGPGGVLVFSPDRIYVPGPLQPVPIVATPV